MTRVITDKDILASASVSTENESEEEVDESEDVPIVSTEDARAALQKVRILLQRCDLKNDADGVFASVAQVDNVIDSNFDAFLIQRKITNFCERT